jgi:hypothetical protein
LSCNNNNITKSHFQWLTRTQNSRIYNCREESIEAHVHDVSSSNGHCPFMTVVEDPVEEVVVPAAIAAKQHLRVG